MSHNNNPINGKNSSTSKFWDKSDLAEWCEGSGVSEAIAKTALTSLTDHQVIAKLLGWKKYPDHFPLGWWVSGLDLETMQPQTCGQFKPKEPVQTSPDADEAKYLTPKTGYDAIALPHPDKDYWQRVIDDPSIPIALDEGGKKAGLLMTLGFVALALCGVWMGLKKGGKELVKNLALLAVQGRPITLVFDSDLATNVNVQQALKALATVLKKKGCIISVAIMPLELGYKGIDDVWAQHGPGMVKKIMADAIPYSQWLKSLEVQAAANVIRPTQFQIPHISELGGEIEALLKSDLKKSQLQLKVSELAQKFRMNSADVWRIYRERELELEQEASQEDTRIGIEQLLASQVASVKLSEIFPESLATPIEIVATRMNLKPECYALALISGVSRFLKNGSSTMLVEEWNRYRCRTFGYFGALIAESSQMKTPVLNAMITDPLVAMREKNQQKFEAEKKAYEKELEQSKNSTDEDKGPAPDAPVEKFAYITKATWEGIAGMVGRNPTQGILWLCDELAGFFKSANQYRSGKGSDKEDLLECWSGNGAVIARAAGTTVNVGAVSLSIYGNIQPKVLAPFLRDGSDDNGTFARFDFVQQQPALTQITLGLSKIDINPMLQALYEKMDAIPVTEFALDEEARKLFVDYYNHCQRLRLNHPKQGMRAMLGKAAEKVGRVATILHCIHAAHLGGEVSPKIPTSRVRAAIKWVEYTTQQALSINIEVCDSEALESNLTKIISLAERKGGTVSVRDVSKSFTAKYRPSAQKIRDWFTELATLNYGDITTQGQSILFSLTKTPPLPPVGWEVDIVTVTGGGTRTPTVPPLPPPSNITTPSTHSSGGKWGQGGGNTTPTLESLPDIDLTSSGGNGGNFTPSPKTSQPSMLSCTTESEKSSTKTSATKTPTFKEGDRVAVKDVGGLYQGARGEILGKFYDRDNLVTYLVKFDKRVGNVQQHDFEPTELMKL